MDKPSSISGYDDEVTRECERVLVTLLRGLGPWKDSVYLIGGLTPRYLIPERAGVPAHAGTADVDVVVDVEILLDVEAYKSLEENLKRMGFERGENDKHQKVSWRWQARLSRKGVIVIDILTDAPELSGGKVTALPTAGGVSAMNIPHSSIVFDMHDVKEIRAELPDGNGVAIEKIRHANLVAFVCLKCLAFEHRGERKDAHDLTYCIEHWPHGHDGAVALFRDASGGKHGDVIRRSVEILKSRFVDDQRTEGYRKDGCVAVAKFEVVGEEAEEAVGEQRTLRQRQVADIIGRLCDGILARGEA